jgi:DNA-binding response OmpR family regulator
LSNFLPVPQRPAFCSLLKDYSGNEIIIMDKSVSILIIDDEQDFCKLIINIFRLEPFLLECAYTLRAAGKILDLKSPDFILLDNNLPDGKGIDFLQECNSLFAKSKVIMMTTDVSDYLRQCALRLGVYDFLVKPFSFLILRDMICAVPDNV